jgi:hypothetical protein
MGQRSESDMRVWSPCTFDDSVLSILLVAELLYSLQWCEELDNPPIFLTGFCEMLQKMSITYDNLCALGNTSNLLRLLFNR